MYKTQSKRSSLKAIQHGLQSLLLKAAGDVAVPRVQGLLQRNLSHLCYVRVVHRSPQKMPIISQKQVQPNEEKIEDNTSACPAKGYFAIEVPEIASKEWSCYQIILLVNNFLLTQPILHSLSFFYSCAVVGSTTTVTGRQQTGSKKQKTTAYPSAAVKRPSAIVQEA